MKLKHPQQGLTLSGLIFGCVLVGIVALTGMKLFPLYNEKMKVDFALEKVANTPGSARFSEADIVKAMLKQFEVSDVDRFDRVNLSKIIQIQRKKGSKPSSLSMAYEIRRPFLADLDVVLKYNRVVELSSSGAGAEE